MSIGSEIYDTAAAVAVFRAWIGIGIFCIIFCITSYFGISLYKSEDKYDKNNITAKIQKSECTRDFNKNNKNNNNNNNNNYDCSLNLIYNLENQNYENILLTNNSKYYGTGENIDIRYSKYDKKDITQDMYSNTFKGSIIIIIGLILLIGSFINLYIVKNFKFMAAAQTATSLAGSLSSAVFGSRR